jgi:hypothetical protein
MQAVTPFFTSINDAHHGLDDLPARCPAGLHRFPELAPRARNFAKSSLVRSKDLAT